MADPFFDSLNKSIDNVVPLAMKKWEIDQAAERFNQEMGIKNQMLDMERKKFDQEVSKIAQRNKFKEAVTKMMQPQPVTSVDPQATASTAAMPEGAFSVKPDLLPSITTMKTPDIDPRKILMAGLENTGEPEYAKQLVELAKVKEAAPKTPKVTSVDRGDVVDIYTDGVLTSTQPKGKLPKDEKPGEKWSEPYESVIGGKKVMLKRNLATNEVKPVVQDVSTTVRINQSGTLTDKDILMPQIKALPKMKQAAQESARRVTLYQDLSKMADAGAGGLVPGLKGILSPMLEALGMESKIESEAQAYQLMARAGVGSMRLMLVGSGQVSNYEQDLMQRLSGGSIKTSREAAKLLFKYYATESKKVVDDYNNTVADVSEVEPGIGKVYKPIKYTVGNKEKKIDTPVTPAINAKGWKLHTDAKGNKAYVSPNGQQFEEVK